MKKILLLVVLLLTAFVSFTLIKTKAVAFNYTEVDLVDLDYTFREVPTGFTDAGNMSVIINGSFPSTYDLLYYPIVATYIKASLPLQSYYGGELQVIFGDDLNVYSESGAWSVFNNYIYDNQTSFLFNLNQPFFGDDISNTGEFVIYTTFNFDYDTPPSNFEADFMAGTSVKFGYLLTYYEFYIKDGEDVYFHSMLPMPWGKSPTEEQIDLPTLNNRVFVGYQNKDGEYIRLKNIKSADFEENSDGYPSIKLYANYLYLSGTIVVTPPEAETTVIGEILAMFRGNNAFGFSLVFLILTVVTMFIFVWKSWPIFGYVAIHLVLTVVFWVLQLLPIYVIIINLLIYAIAIITTVKKSQNGGNVESE